MDNTVLAPPEAFSLHREINSPHVLITHPYDRDEYFIVDTTDDVTRACLFLLTENDSEKMYPTRESITEAHEETLRRIAAFESPGEALLRLNPFYRDELVRGMIEGQEKEPDKTPSELLADSARRHAEGELAKDLWFADHVAAVLAVEPEDAIKMTIVIADGSEVNLVKHLIELRQEWPLESVELVGARPVNL